jgi:alkylhydroperoxidase family enzyme
MARIKPIYALADCPAGISPADRADVAAMFQSLFPGVAEPMIDRSHAGMAIAAHNPQLALNAARFSRFVVVDMPWCDRADLRELSILVVNRHFHCSYGEAARQTQMLAAGLGPALQITLSDWEESPLFDEQQRLVIAYTLATVQGSVTDSLSAQIVDCYGEKGAVEFTAAIAWWSFWAMFLTATGATMDGAD